MLLQRGEQNGYVSRTDDLPHSGQGRVGRNGVTREPGAADMSFLSLMGISDLAVCPIGVNWIVAIRKQAYGFLQGKANHVGI